MDLPKFERAVVSLSQEKELQIAGLRGEMGDLQRVVDRERAEYLAADLAARW